MNVVIVNTVCDTGSTGRISANIARIASDRGHDVFFGYGRGSCPNDINGFKIGNRLDFGFHVLLNFFRGESGFGSKAVTKRFLKYLDEIQPDVINLHNIHGFYLNYELLFDYIKRNNIRVIWTFHDCLPFTGHCAYFDYANCKKWMSHCHECPVYRTQYPYSLFCENSSCAFDRKKAAFTGVEDMRIVVPCDWMKENVRQSFLRDYHVQTIYNGIDIGKFHILTLNEINNNLIDEYSLYEKKIVLGVANIWDRRKGLSCFIRLDQDLPDEYVIVVLGLNKKQIVKYEKETTSRIHLLPRMGSIEELVQWYNLATVFVNPTIEDNFPTTNLEALACGTPVVTYRTGGSPESLDETVGIVVEKGDYDSLRENVETLSKSVNKELSLKCRMRAEGFDSNIRFSEYLTLIEGC